MGSIDFRGARWEQEDRLGGDCSNRGERCAPSSFSFFLK